MRWFVSATSAVSLILSTSVVLAHQAPRNYDTHSYYVLEHDPSSSTAPSHHEVVRELGAELVEQVGELKDHWLIRIPREHLDGRQDDPVLNKMRSLRRRAAVARVSDHIQKRDVLHARRIASSVRSLEAQVPRQRTKRWLYHEDQTRSPSARRTADDDDDADESPTVQRYNKLVKELDIKDPEFHTQWHLINIKTPPHDMNVTGVWEMGYTGKGVISAIVDDGLDFNSEDLADNYVRRVLVTEGSHAYIH